MIAYVFTIQATEAGIAQNGFKIVDSDEPSEKVMAGILDMALGAVSKKLAEIVSSQTGAKVTMIEGKHIEEAIASRLEQVNAFDLKKALKQSGYKLPQD